MNLMNFVCIILARYCVWICVSHPYKNKLILALFINLVSTLDSGSRGLSLSRSEGCCVMFLGCT